MVRGSPCDPAMGVRDDDPGFGPAPAGRKRVLSATRLAPPVKPAAGPVALRPRLSTGLPLSRALLVLVTSPLAVLLLSNSPRTLDRVGKTQRGAAGAAPFCTIMLIGSATY